jgi:hypothetical protein
MHVRVLDLDDALNSQTQLHRSYRPSVHDARDWGPHVRLGCRFGRFRRFTAAVDTLLRDDPPGPALTFYGSGDFHHVTLALLHRLKGPFNLLVLDNHPDWMRAIPFLHCGTWLYHAARLPQVRRIFHLGGNVDFDNGFRWLAPWPMLRSGKITVLPGTRSFTRGRWANVPNEPLRPAPHSPLSLVRLAWLLRPYRVDLRRYPLYISLDKDVLREQDATVNWDSGTLTLAEVGGIVSAFLDACGGELAGADIVGDWSPVRTRGLLRWGLHVTEHPRLNVRPDEATRRNERTNLALLRHFRLEPAVLPAIPAQAITTRNRAA